MGTVARDRLRFVESVADRYSDGSVKVVGSHKFWFPSCQWCCNMEVATLHMQITSGPCV